MTTIEKIERALMDMICEGGGDSETIRKRAKRIARIATPKAAPTVTEAALALINAYGGDVPPWLQSEVAALVEAIDREALEENIAP
ncbi:MAG: hypothetical protein E6Q77_06580 [Rhizobium sp.]|nr:MAG: hypothetical protein E6Q77_06580 [Rhizobium sp.]